MYLQFPLDYGINWFSLLHDRVCRLSCIIINLFVRYGIRYLWVIQTAPLTPWGSQLLQLRETFCLRAI